MKKEKSILPYHSPDERWNLFGASNFMEYVDKFVIKAKFHTDVPKDIKDAWLTLEFILAHAYYYWSMYDEGYNKALLMIEMAIKLKAKILGVHLKVKNNRGEEYDRRLVDIIKDVFVGDHFEKLKADIHRARKLRNTQMHSDRNLSFGIVGNIPLNIKFFINILNAIFKDEEWHKKQYFETNLIKPVLKSYEKTLLIFEKNNQSGMLIYGILDFKLQNNRLLIAINAIRRDISKIISNHISIHPIIIIIEDYTIDDLEILGKSSQGSSIKLFKTDKPDNQSVLDNYLQQIQNCDTMDVISYLHGLKRNTSWDMIETEHNCFW